MKNLVCFCTFFTMLYLLIVFIVSSVAMFETDLLYLNFWWEFYCGNGCLA